MTHLQQIDAKPGKSQLIHRTRKPAGQTLRDHDREEAIIRLYLERLRQVGGYKYVGTTRIRDPNKDRTYFHLAYGTRHPAGMEVFRRSEGHCVDLQERIVLDAYHERREQKFGQSDLLAALPDQGYEAFRRWRDASHGSARAEWEA